MFDSTVSTAEKSSKQFYSFSTAERSSRSIEWPDNGTERRRCHPGVQSLGESCSIDSLDKEGS